MDSRKIKITKRKFGRLTIVGDVLYKHSISRRKDGTTYKRKRAFVKCKCTCGIECVVPYDKVIRGETRSCGCIKNEMYANLRKHNTSSGDCKTNLYKVWMQMKRRCLNEKWAGYEFYGGRGITVCKEWMDDFSKFKEWANKNGYSEGKQLDRINVNGNYEPQNCRFVSAKDNARNRRNTIFVEYDGRKMSLCDLIEFLHLGIDARTVEKRMYRGMDITRALSKPKLSTSGIHNVKVKVKLLNKDAIIPQYQHKGDAGMDLHSIEDVTIPPKASELVQTGIAIQMPYGLEAQIRSRSGLALKKKVFVLNSPGTIDQNYIGPIGVILMNMGSEKFVVHKGDRIAQMVFSEVVNANLFKVKFLGQTDRGKGGFGSTGG